MGHLWYFEASSAILLLSCRQKSGECPPWFHGSAPLLSGGLCLGQGFAMGCHRLRGCSAPVGAKEATTTLHVLALLRDVLPCFPAAVVKTCCETLLRVMTLSHVVSVPSPGMTRADPFPMGCTLEGIKLSPLPAGSLEMQDANGEEPRTACWPDCCGRGRLCRWGTVAAVLSFPGQSLLWGRRTVGSRQSPLS